MKQLKVVLLILFIFSLQTIQAEENAQQQIIYIKNTPVITPLMHKWIEQYASIHPEVKIELVGKNGTDPDLDFTTLPPQESEQSSGKLILEVGRLAILPVVSKENPVLEQLNKKKLNKKEIRQLFFFDDPLLEAENKKKNNPELTVYSSNLTVSGAGTFAAHFGFEKSDIRGKKISGDDVFLLQAIKKDQTGVTFNNISYLYDAETRRLKEELVLLPLDLKKDQAEIIQSGDLDETIKLLEKTTLELVPIQPVNLLYPANYSKSIVQDFVAWILTEGQDYNHDFGFLKTGGHAIAQQKQYLEQNKLTASKAKQ